MSKETIEWLNANTLIGYTDEHGNAWHFDGASDNQFTGAVPIDRVASLFEWQAELVDVCYPDENEGDFILIPGYNAVIHGESKQVLNMVGSRYEIHQYNDWLLENIQSILDVSAGDLTIGSAGLLKGGGQAWLQVRPPESVTIGGDEMVPWILATTSHDGSLATQYKGQRQRTVCDNTLAIALGENTAEFKVKHMRGSSTRLGEARQALDIIYTAQDEFDQQIEQMMNTPFSEDQFRDLNNGLYPLVQPDIDVDGKVTNQRAINQRSQTVADLIHLWNTDERVTPFKNTQWGAMQAHNTWFHWNRTHGTSGGDETLMKARQMKSTIDGSTAAYDAKVRHATDYLVSA